MEDLFDNVGCDYPPLDYSRLLTPGENFVVHCETEAEAAHLVYRMIHDYPEKCRLWDDGVKWGIYERQCYRPNLNNDGALKYGSMDFYEEEGFAIIPFYDLLIQEIDVSEEPISLLLGGDE